ncbi:hypothetical protein DBV15_11033 [Temnothorax longispinosus]|uniref:Uncharacterized protein n=1 Tax=Temnothorax longispinosus TaxID=300112 RepID=A0A4V3SAW4_9HYME|nr:hypothetical protein DBV15_11033 [Temnothorax longispinosus]
MALVCILDFTHLRDTDEGYLSRNGLVSLPIGITQVTEKKSRRTSLRLGLRSYNSFYRPFVSWHDDNAPSQVLLSAKSYRTKFLARDLVAPLFAPITAFVYTHGSSSPSLRERRRRSAAPSNSFPGRIAIIMVVGR